LEVSGPVDLEVSSGSGSITVTTGASDVVRVMGKIRARSGGGFSAEEKVRRLEENPPIDQRGNVIRIGKIYDYDLRDNVSISYELTVPVETSLDSNTGSGSQRIGDIRGPVEASSGSGSLSLGNIGGSVEASAGSGSIEVDSVGGALDVSTGSGRIRAGGVAGAIESSSGSGSVEIEQTAPGDVEIETGSGSVRVSGVRGALRVKTGSGSIRASGEPTGDWRLRASSGTVTLQVPEDVGFELDAHTSSGSIESDHPITLVGRLSKRELRGTVRGGGPLVEVSTSSGSVRIR
jgi:DUF4097 and DUF4098 domain-containing protein YvlB